MTNTRLTARCAPVAIAAILALGTTPGFAQDAQTAPTALPTTGTVPPPSPTFPAPPIMQSPVTPAPAPTTTNTNTNPATTTASRYVSNPQVQTLPEPAPSATAEASPPAATATKSAAAAPAARATSSRTAAAPSRATTAAPVATTSAAPPPDAATMTDSVGSDTTAPIAEYDPTMPLPAETTVMPAGELDAANESGMIGLLAAALAGLIPIGLAIGAVVWWRRRSRPVAAAPQPTVVTKSEPVPPKAEPMRSPDFTREEAPRPAVTPRFDPAPAAATAGGVALAERTRTEAKSDVRYDEPEVPSDDVRPTAPASPAAKSDEQGRSAPAPTLRQGALPRTSEERSRFVEGMVDARPDEANPFHTRKARRRRARLILASKIQAARDAVSGTDDGNWLSNGGWKTSPA